MANRLPPYSQSIAGTLLAAREAVMGPIRPVLRKAGVTEQQWRVLRVLCDQGPTDASGLAIAAMLHPPSVTRILRQLLERGLVLRKNDTHDRRRSIVAVTPDGRALVSATARHTLRLLEIYAKEFGGQRLADLGEELAALKAALERIDYET